MARPSLPSNPAWHARFRTPEIYTAQVAYRRPSRGLVAVKLVDKPQLYAWDVQRGSLSALTALDGGTYNGALLSDGSGAIYLHDESGDEKGHFTLVDFEGTTRTELTPDIPPYAQAGACCARRADTAAIGLALENGFETSILQPIRANTFPQGRTLYRTSQISGWPELSSDGTLAAVHTTEINEGNRYSVRVLDTSDSASVGLLTEGRQSSIEFVSFSPIPGDSRLLAFSDSSGAARPLIWDPRDDTTRRLPLPQLHGDVKPLDWSPDGNRLILMQIHMARQALHLYDLDTGSIAPLASLRGSLGLLGGVFGREAFFAPDGALFALLQDAQHPIRIVELDPSTGATIREVLNLGDAPPGQPFESVTFNSADGTPIQGWLAKPPLGTPPYPTILHTHGGPEAVQVEEFLPEAQAWLDNGFAFLTVNYRGSTTFGKDFKEQIWGSPGTFEVEDLIAARAWCVDANFSDPKRVFLTGYSYGGYLTLLAMGKAPSLWAGGMALAAISDWRLSHALSNPSLKSYCEALFLGTPEQRAEAYAAASPISYATEFSAPVLIIQGTNDSRTPAAPIREFQAEMNRLGKPIRVEWYEAGHVGPSVDQWIQFQQEMMDFAVEIAM